MSTASPAFIATHALRRDAAVKRSRRTVCKLIQTRREGVLADRALAATLAQRSTGAAGSLLAFFFFFF